jgi:hypothetical protein
VSGKKYIVSLAERRFNKVQLKVGEYYHLKVDRYCDFTVEARLEGYELKNNKMECLVRFTVCYDHTREPDDPFELGHLEIQTVEKIRKTGDDAYPSAVTLKAIADSDQLSAIKE